MDKTSFVGNNKTNTVSLNKGMSGKPNNKSDFLTAFISSRGPVLGSGPIHTVESDQFPFIFMYSQGILIEGFTILVDMVNYRISGGNSQYCIINKMAYHFRLHCLSPNDSLVKM